MIEQLVQNISNDNIRDFFKRKLPSFTPETEELDYILPENGYYHIVGSSSGMKPALCE